MIATVTFHYQQRCGRHSSSWRFILSVMVVATSLLVVVLTNSSSSLRMVQVATAWTIATPVSQLLQEHSVMIQELKSIVQTYASDKNGIMNVQELPYNNDVYYLRYCVSSNDDTDDDPKSKLQQSLEWRTSPQGQAICNAARTAVQRAISSSSSSSSTTTTSWQNNQENVFALAPFASKIGQYITPTNCITTSNNNNDLIYCIRAGAINDVELFKHVSIDEMIQFFLYIKEVHALVCDIRSVQYNQLLYTITCNDLSNVKLLGGSSDFRKALSTSSTMASTMIYPDTYTGPTLLCNLPILVSALVQLFTPLFPEKVKRRLKFVQGPLSNINDLQDITLSSTKPQERTKFIQQVQTALQ